MNLEMCAAKPPDTATRTAATADAIRPTVTDIATNGWLLTAVRDYLAGHDQMSANTMWLADGLAFLSRNGEYVNLHLVGRDNPLEVFMLDYRAGWREVPDLDRQYAEWSQNGH